VAWSHLRTWVTWLHDRYELAVEDRLPRCWAQHPGLIEELWALKAWREEIYGADRPSGQAARYWHAELRQVIQAATTVYAAGCRTGHRAGRRLAADDSSLQQRWAAASPITGIPAATLAGGPQRNRPGQWLSPAAMAEALDDGTARALSTMLPDHICCAGAWWRPGAGGWTRITDAALITRLDSWATRMAAADAQAAQRRTAPPERSDVAAPGGGDSGSGATSASPT